jgi:hypothetical protein
MRKIKSFSLFESSTPIKWRWALSNEMKTKIDKEINNVLIELIDNGFEIEIDHFAKKIAGQNSILVSIGKNEGRTSFNTNDVKDNILVLLDYMDEYYGVKSHSYLTQVRIPIENGYKYDDVIVYEYPDNLDTNEISLDIVI